MLMGVQSVGIDLSLQGNHRAEALDEPGYQWGHLTFSTSPEGLEALARLCAQTGDSLTVVMEPTGLAWLPINLFLRAHFPQALLVRAKEQNRLPILNGVLERCWTIKEAEPPKVRESPNFGDHLSE
jgi:hypothetical protein